MSNFDFIVEEGVLAQYVGAGGDIVIPERVKRIGDKAFKGCAGLTSVTIPEGVDGIGELAFVNCRQLRSVNIPKSVTSIGKAAFENCSSLTSAVVPEGTEVIGECMFYGCEKLTSVIVPDSVRIIDKAAFYGCSGLSSAPIHKGVAVIGESAFEGCKGLTSVTFPEGVTRIDWRAFIRCSGLVSVTIPESVMRIRDDAFFACSGLREIVLRNGGLRGSFYRSSGGFSGLGAILEFTAERSMANFKRLSDNDRSSIAVFMMHTYPKNKFYREYINENISAVMSALVELGDVENIESLLSEKMISRDDIDGVIEASLTRSQNVEVRALLMNYKHENFSESRLDNLEI
ncbi:MAG: leucine-rich repeat domain-containing protein [Oscillospiraceae bacterium]|nr:leucine-rich repeat domain-containing protein [Oscillospiraceae bacterium]